MGGERYYTFARKDVRFFVLDTNLMDAKQLAWIDGRAAAVAGDLEDLPTSIIRSIPTAAATAPTSSCAWCSSRCSCATAWTSCSPATSTSTSGTTPQKGITHFIEGSSGQLRKGDITADRDDGGVVRPGSDVHAGGDRRRRDALPDDLADRARRRFRRDSPAADDLRRGDGHDRARVVARASVAGVATSHRRWRASARPLRDAIASCCCRSARLVALVWANTAAESYFRFAHAARLSGQRDRDGVLSRADHAGGRRGTDAGRGAAHLAPLGHARVVAAAGGFVGAAARLPRVRAAEARSSAGAGMADRLRHRHRGRRTTC